MNDINDFDLISPEGNPGEPGFIDFEPGLKKSETKNTQGENKDDLHRELGDVEPEDLDSERPDVGMAQAPEKSH